VGLVTSGYVLDELVRVSRYPKVARKFPVLATRVPLLIGVLGERRMIRPEPGRRVVYERDPKDAPYIDLAVASGAMLIVSRDKDLLDLMLDGDVVGRAIRSEHPDFRVLTPPVFLGEVLGGTRG
jgi:putative PIN family toxin of toxin-antitoxin system